MSIQAREAPSQLVSNGSSMRSGQGSAMPQLFSPMVDIKRPLNLFGNDGLKPGMSPR